ncbi:NAD(P)/FAD-dependent oxidoreductase [Caldilinea sp.]|uniref:NAD(P)/FAD-dependent oxidoreductase n=1 Tax=Caldilinea sp. TaxID=2293560 RepID=UPI0021DCED8A|nr:FAD-dependent oxidoreductase [Caldilinea sp.]GIV68351.1 MAG: hypothetical protein KatS3mg048_1213 [Caldilinea sp.]
MPEAPRVAIVGAGFGGLWAARALAHTPVQVLLLDRNNYHTFLPLLYQVAAAELEPEAIAYPVRSILRRMPNVSFALAEVRQVDLNSRRLETSAGTISYDLLILAAGSAPHFFGTSGTETNHPEVYVIGDLAYVEQDGSPLPMVAPVAIQQGRFAAQNVLRQLWGQQPLPFRYHDQGAMVTIGRNAAVVQLRNLEFTGFPAWVLWLSVHLFNLVGFRNRLLVMLNWAWDYFFFERTVRLILP